MVRLTTGKLEEYLVASVLLGLAHCLLPPATLIVCLSLHYASWWLVSSMQLTGNLTAGPSQHRLAWFSHLTVWLWCDQQKERLYPNGRNKQIESTGGIYNMAPDLARCIEQESPTLFTHEQHLNIKRAGEQHMHKSSWGCQIWIVIGN